MSKTRLEAFTAQRVDIAAGDRWQAMKAGSRSVLHANDAGRILDLLDERTALVARAEQAERDRDTLARLAHAWNLRDQRQEEHDATSIASDGTQEALEDAKSALGEAWRSASGALARSKEQA